MPVRRAVGSVFQSAALGLFVLLGSAVIGLVLNWVVVLFGVGPIADRIRGVEAAGGGALLSAGVLIAVLGVAFPLAWLWAAQPFAATRAARHAYRRHKGEVLDVILQAVERHLGGTIDTTAERVTAALRAVRERLEDVPRLLKPVVRLALREAKLDRLEASLQGGSGPIGERVREAIDAYVEDDLMAGGATALRLVLVVNLLVIAGIWIVTRG